MPDPAHDSLVIAGRFELIGDRSPSLDPAFTSAAGTGITFGLRPGYDPGAPQPVTDFLGSLILDGELPSGRRASNRTITLPVVIKAPDFATLAAATEALLAAVDQPYWTLTWTRKQGAEATQLPLVFDCFRAHASVMQGGGVDQLNINPVAAVTLSFDALPYGRSDTPVVVSLASPLPGGPSPASPVILDTFSSVSSPDFTQSSRHVLDSFSAKWAHSGGSTYPTYTKSFSALSLAGLYNITAYVGFGAATLSSWQNPILFTFRLGDSHGKFLSFSLTKNCYPSNDPSSPAFTLIHARIPLGVATFDYANVTSYRIQAQNAPSGLFTPANFGFDTYYNHIVANPQSIQVPATRGYVYQLPGVQGTARAPVSVAAQLPGASLTEVLDTPGPGKYTAPIGLTGGVAAVACWGPSGAGASVTGPGQGGGGEGGEYAAEPALALTAGNTYDYVIGAAGTPQTSISTLTVLTASLPNGVASASYSFQFTASGGSGTGYTWSRSGTALPSALTLSSGGLLSGTLGAGTGTTSGMIFTVTDSLGATASVTLPIVIKPAATFAITTTSLPDGAVGASYSQTLATVNGTAPVTWLVSAGTLPAGLTLSATGVLSGVPAATVTAQAFTVTANDSAAHTDTQALTLTITSVAVSALPSYACNQGSAWPPAGGVWSKIRTALGSAVTGQAYGFRGYGNSGSGTANFPTSWNDHIAIPAAATWVMLDWKPVITTVLSGGCDAAITQWAKSCQAQWNKNPGSIYPSIWHELDTVSGTSAAKLQCRQLHAYIYPRFKAFAPDVPYGQIFVSAALVSDPSGWLSCRSTVSGGSDLDWYGLDIYAHGRTASQALTPAIAAIQGLVPNADISIPETNCEYNVVGGTPQITSKRPAWFNDLIGIVTNPANNIISVIPFWQGADNSQNICWLSNDTATITANKNLLAACAPLGTVPIGSDPPAVDAGITSFPGDAVTVTAGGGRSATSITGAGLIPAPSGLGSTAVGTGGTFAAGTYFWKITGVNAFGETTGSAETSKTLVLNGSCNLAWSALPAGTTGVKVYRGTASNAENVLVTTLGAVVAYTDTGTAGTAATVPSVNTTGLANISANTTHFPGGAGAAGAASGGAGPGTPYLSATAVGSGTGTLAATLTHAVAAGDAHIVGVSLNTGAINSVTDSKGNAYTQSGFKAVTVNGLQVWAYVALNCTAMTTSDTVTVSHTGTTNTCSIVALGCSGVLTANALDVSISSTATSTAPSVGPTPALAQASEWVIGMLISGNGGGSPTPWTGGVTLKSTQHSGSTQYFSVADQVVSATTAKTLGNTVLSTGWAMLCVTLKFTSGGGTAYGGGGGSSAGTAAGGGAGTLSAGGIAPAGGFAGGTGSATADTPPLQGAQPGGAGGGAASTGAAMTGAYGQPGRITITRSTSQEKFSSLLLHLPGPDAPDAFSPLVQLGTPGVPGDGVTEYPVPPLVTGGPNADFDGTYTIVAAASTLNAPQQSRTVIITVRQYEYAGGPFRDLHTFPRTFTPVDDVTGNGLVVIADLTLPHWDVPPDASSGNYTVIIDDDNPADIWSDLMFIDTAGTLVCIDDDIPGAYSEFFIDEPPPVRDLGRILGTSSTRAAAISVLDKCLAVSGGPLSVYPGDNQILAWSRQGAPQLSVSYIPRFFSSRTS